MESAFTTIHFRPQRLAAVQKQLVHFLHSLPPKTPVVATWEQEGNSKLTRGTRPHLHIVTLNPPASYSRLVRLNFLPLTRDIITNTLNTFRTGDIILRYLTGKKKSALPGQSDMTESWKTLHKLQNVVLHNAPVIARRNLSPSMRRPYRLHEPAAKRR